MKLSYTMKSLEGIDEAYRSLYTQEGDVFVLTGIEGVSSKAKVDEFRTNNINLQNQLNAYGDITVDVAKTLRAENGEMKIRLEKNTLDDEQIQKLVNGRVQNLITTHTDTVNKLNADITSLNAMVSYLTIDSQVKSAAVANGVEETAIQDVILRANNVFSLDDNKSPVAKDKDGNVIFDATGQKPISISDWVKSLQKSSPHLFKESVRTKIPGRPSTNGMKGMSALQKISAGLG